MSMIKCPECGHNISSMAKACPECGYPLEEHKEEIESQLKEKAASQSGAAAPVIEEAKPAEPVDEQPKVEEPIVEEPKPVQPEPVQPVAPKAEPAQPVVQPETPKVEPIKPTVQPEQPVKAVETPKSQPTATQPTAPDPEQPNCSRAETIIISIVALIVIIIGGYFCLDIPGESSREDKAFAALHNCNDPLVFEDFIAKYPDHDSIEWVRKRYEELSAQESEWASLIMTGSREQLMDFIKKNPTSIFASKAKQRVDSLDWQYAQSRGTQDAYERYVADHPEGIFIDQAESQLSTLERKAQEAAEAAKRDTTVAAATDSTAAQ